MTKVVLDNIASGYDLSKVNANFQKIEDELNDRVLYRDNVDGEPNQLEDDIDVNSKFLYNVPTPTDPSHAVNKIYVDTLAGIAPAEVAEGFAEAAEASANAAAISAANALSAESNAETAESNAAASAALAASYSSLGLGGAAAFDFGMVTDILVIFPTDYGFIP